MRQFEAERVNPTKWNEEYQEIFERVSKTPMEVQERLSSMEHVISRFVKHTLVERRADARAPAACSADLRHPGAAQVMARVLVTQQPWSATEHWIPLSTLGGQAGGKKFRVGEVLYKFAEPLSVYPDRTCAQKAAAREIVAMNAVIAANFPQLHLSLTALYLIRGHCVIATAVAPLFEGSLIYGSADAGKNVAFGQRCPQALPFIRQLAKTLNLREHSVRHASENLWLPIDTEVHLGADGEWWWWWWWRRRRR
jgi:hypothetical protein